MLTRVSAPILHTHKQALFTFITGLLYAALLLPVGHQSFFPALLNPTSSFFYRPSTGQLSLNNLLLTLKTVLQLFLATSTIRNDKVFLLTCIAVCSPYFSGVAMAASHHTLSIAGDLVFLTLFTSQVQTRRSGDNQRFVLLLVQVMLDILDLGATLVVGMGVGKAALSWQVLQMISRGARCCSLWLVLTLDLELATAFENQTGSQGLARDLS